MPGHGVEVTVVVVTWNSVEVLPGFLASLADGLRGVASHRLIIVDNASSDGTLAAAAATAPEATIVEMGRNAGYAAAINAGIAVADDISAILVANPDVRVGPGCVAQMLEVLRLRPEVGIVVPRLRHPDGSLAKSLRREPTLLRAIGEAVLGGNVAGRWAATGEVVLAEDVYMRPGVCAWASGALMLVARACVERVGAWDESFFLYSEETEFALRARDAGFVTWYVPDASAEHAGGEAHRSPELWALLTLNRWRLYRRRHGRLASAAFRSALTIGEALRAAVGRTTSRAALRSLLSGTLPPVGDMPTGPLVSGVSWDR